MSRICSRQPVTVQALATDCLPSSAALLMVTKATEPVSEVPTKAPTSTWLKPMQRLQMVWVEKGEEGVAGSAGELGEEHRLSRLSKLGWPLAGCLG